MPKDDYPGMNAKGWEQKEKRDMYARTAIAATIQHMEAQTGMLPNEAIKNAICAYAAFVSEKAFEFFPSEDPIQDEIVPDHQETPF